MQSKGKSIGILFIFLNLIIQIYCNIVILKAEPLKYEQTTVLSGHNDLVLSIAWSPDGNKLASGSYDHSIKIWDVKTSENIITLLGHTDRITALAWSPDGEKFASGSSDGNITIWNTETWKKIMMFEIHGNRVNILVWNPNSTILASGNEDSTIGLFDFRNNSTLRFINETDAVKYIAWNRNGTQLASVADFIGYAWNNTTAFGGTHIKFWNVVTGQELGNYSLGHGLIAWSPNETEFAVSGRHPECEFCIYDLSPLDWIIRADFDRISPPQISSIVYSPDGGKIALLSQNSTNITLLNVTTGESETLIGHAYHSVKTVAWSPDGKMLASGSDNDIIIWKKPAPDVHLDSIEVDKGNIILGDNINITVVLKNNGAADGLNIKVELFDGLTYLNTNYLDVLSGHFNGFKFLWRTNNSTPLGLHNFRAIFGLEEKNVTVLVNAIPRPNVYVMDMTVGESNITVGKSTMITATIANNGTADATDVNVSFYADKTLLKTIRENITKGGVVTINLEWTTKHTTVGDHVLKVVVGNSYKQTTVHVNKRPTINLNYSISAWLIGLIILLIIIISLILGYDAYIKGLNK